MRDEMRYILQHRLPHMAGAIWGNDRPSNDFEVILTEARHSVSSGLEARVYDRYALRVVFHEIPAYTAVERVVGHTK